jgi:hypothetical protein
VTIPATTHVEAKIVHYGKPVTMKAYSDGALLSSHSSGSEQGLIHTLSIDGTNIDKVVLTSSSVEAVLLEFSFATLTEKNVTLRDYPHIVDVEPKTRDLYQSTTESGEVLTSSNTGLNTGKSFSSLSNSQTDVNFKGDWGDMSHTWGTSNEDSWSVETDATRERREMQSTTTQLSQLYNLLTAYHAGTNRATFLMLARPHVLQPSDRRTFVQGARIIEGIQDFILIIVRPRSMDGLCFEAALDTGHFPEDVEIAEPTEKYDEGTEDFEVTHFVNQGTFRNCESFSKTHTLETGWIVDRDKGDSGHPGVEEIDNNSNSQANDTLTNYSYGVLTDHSVSVSGNVCGSGAVNTGPGTGDASFKRTYRVHKRSEEPIGDTVEGSADIGDLFITVRHLCACMKSTDILRTFPGFWMRDRSKFRANCTQPPRPGSFGKLLQRNSSAT